ncbi:MAG TPA: TetR/AcrR family transcriptional regulator [Streptosporangiaceae bacterium]|nr:TetR/AcrR family transcriptional regulator [Streptosporangiaceae bacterium]
MDDDAAEPEASDAAEPAAASRRPGRPASPRPRGDTRERIQAVALELFAEQGYEKTSLREIAERLGVTKAALYYHFKSKEDIVRSFTEDYVHELDALIAWGSDQPLTADTRALLLARYSGIVSHRIEVMRFLEHNQAAIDQLMTEHGGQDRKKLFREQFLALRNLLTPPGAPLRDRVRATMAIASVGLGCMLYHSEVPAAELDQVILDLACELADVPAPPRAS